MIHHIIHGSVLLLLTSCYREPATPPLALYAPSVPPLPRQEPTQTIPPGAERMRIHWKLKLPHLQKCQGDYVFRDRESFRALLTRASAGESRPVPYEKWNSIDFSRQMALLAVEEHSTSGYGVEI